MPINVGLCHSDAIVNAGLLALLGVLQDMDVGVLDRGDMAAPHSDVIITDGCSAADCLRTQARSKVGLRTPVLVIAQAGREWEVRVALAAGVHGYVLQNCAPEQLVAAVRALGNGRRYLCPELSHIYDAASISLTRRETQVLQLMALGHCNKIIARDLGIGVGTVKTHAKGLFGKLGASARTQAVVIAARRGLVDGRREASRG